MVTISLRVHEETKELYEELKDNRTADNFLATLLEVYQNPKKVEVPAKADEEKINELNETVIDLKNENSLLHAEIQNLTQENESITQSFNEKLQNKVFFELDERIEKILKEVQKRIKEKQNLDITDKNVLFYVGVRDGYLKL